MELDLGSKPTANVKVGTDVYKMSVPNVKLTMDFNNSLSKAKNDFEKSKLFIDFVVKLGMPKEVVENLSMNQIEKLSEGLTGGAEKK